MSDDEVLAELKACDALLEGHFILTSGLRSPRYLQCARLMMFPDRAARLCAELADKVRAAPAFAEASLIVSPAMGGVVVGYEMGRQLGLPAIFAERVAGEFTLRRGFAIAPGTGVLVVEDVVTTGLSSRECIAAVQRAGGQVAMEACLVDRSAGKVALGVPLVALLSLEVPAYEADAVPPDLAAIPAIKPGSRGL